MNNYYKKKKKYEILNKKKKEEKLAREYVKYLEECNKDFHEALNRIKKLSIKDLYLEINTRNSDK